MQVLLIAVDDLRPLFGRSFAEPEVKTPSIDEFFLDGGGSAFQNSYVTPEMFYGMFDRMFDGVFGGAPPVSPQRAVVAGADRRLRSQPSVHAHVAPSRHDARRHRAARHVHGRARRRRCVVLVPPLIVRPARGRCLLRRHVFCAGTDVPGLEMTASPRRSF